MVLLAIFVGIIVCVTNPLQAADYKITVYTSEDSYSGTDANVEIQITGDKGQGNIHSLTGSGNLFEVSSVDEFNVTDKDLGIPVKVQLRHDGAGWFSNWKLDKVIIEDKASQKKYRFICLCWVDVPLQWTVIDVSQSACTQSSSFHHQGIVGGQEAQPGAWPWQVALTTLGRQFCGGSLVSEEYVVTAAHCLDSLSYPSLYKVRLGEHNLYKDEGFEQNIGMSKIWIHPKYDSDYEDYDIAVVKLSSPAKFNSRVKPVCLDKGNNFKPGKMCTVTGWGTLKFEGSSPSALQEVDLPLVSDKNCVHAYGSTITSRMVCAGYAQGGKDSCQGDSGGPLVCQDNEGFWYLSGVVSFGEECAKAGYYGVYAKVDSELGQWVEGITGPL